VSGGKVETPQAFMRCEASTHPQESGDRSGNQSFSKKQQSLRKQLLYNGGGTGSIYRILISSNLNRGGRMKVLETERLILRWAETTDAEFIFQLLNEPGWLRYIGDKGIKTLEDARNYIVNGPRKMYGQIGFGLFVAELKDGSIPIGLCGLIKRDGLEDVDLGFAFLADSQKKGYAYEAAQGTVGYAREKGLKRLVAITTKDNAPSSRLLEKLGMVLEDYVTLPNDTEELKLYALDL